MMFWQQWKRQPQTLWLRKAIFQLHLWSGIGLGLYILMASITGSILVYSNELYRAATRDAVPVSPAGARLTDEQLKDAASRAYPGYTAQIDGGLRNPRQAVAISLRAGTHAKNRFFNPYTGADLGDSVPPGILFISRLAQLHDDLFAGRMGRKVNGAGALVLIVMAFTGIVVWWPGIGTWRRGLTVHRNTGWRRVTRDLHSMVGFWSLGVLLMFGLSGAYLGNPQPFHHLADWIEPATAANAGMRTVDRIIYWLAYLHFGRINGIGIPCGGPGFCDSATKFTWAASGLAPAALFLSGAVMWWNRVVRRKSAKTADAVPRAQSRRRW